MDITTIFKEYLETLPTKKELQATWRGISVMLLSYVTREKQVAFNEIEELGLIYCSKYDKGLELIRDYYHYKFDLPTLHDKLYKLWNSYQKASIFLTENDMKIKAEVIGVTYKI